MSIVQTIETEIKAAVEKVEEFFGKAKVVEAAVAPTVEADIKATETTAAPIVQAVETAAAPVVQAVEAEVKKA
jgi:hypothetical protein